MISFLITLDNFLNFCKKVVYIGGGGGYSCVTIYALIFLKYIIIIIINF